MRNNEQGFSGARRQNDFRGQGQVERKLVREVNDQNYVEEAEKVILEMKQQRRDGKNNPEITTSKLRNLLSMTADIYNIVIHQNSDTLPEEIKARIEYLRVRFYYEAGREEGVKQLVEKAGLVEMLKNIKGSRKKYISFNRYMEALVAFHRFHGGKDI